MNKGGASQYELKNIRTNSPIKHSSQKPNWKFHEVNEP